jgi:hypothetical protein
MIIPNNAIFVNARDQRDQRSEQITANNNNNNAKFENDRHPISGLRHQFCSILKFKNPNDIPQKRSFS